MTEINAINAQVAASPIQEKAPQDNQKIEKIDLKTLYSEEEQNKLLDRFECLQKTAPGSDKKLDFEMSYYPIRKYVVLNSTNMTNNTVEIDANGKARSVGSWHNKEIEGDFSDIIKDIDSKLATQKAEGDAKLTSEMDAMAQLGKSQVAVK